MPMVHRALAVLLLLSDTLVARRLAVLNVGSECYHNCEERGGICPVFCGSSGSCCRQGYDPDSWECAFGTAGCINNHCCTTTSTLLPPLLPPSPPPPLALQMFRRRRLLGVLSAGGRNCAIAPDSAGHVDVPAGYTAIGEGAFEDCSSLVSIILPGTLTTIGE